MYGWVVLSVQGNQLMQYLELLMQVMDSRLQSLATLYSDFHYQGSTEETNTMQNSRLFTTKLGKSKSMDLEKYCGFTR